MFAESRFRPVALAIVVLTLLDVAPCWAATFNVNDTGDAADDNPGDGVCATAGSVCTLRAAVDEANAFGGTDAINIPAGTYIATSESWELTEDATIVGAGSDLTFVDGGGVDRVFSMTGAAVAITGLTVRNGDASSFAGGGIRSDSDLTLNDVIVTGNTTTGHGGGIHVHGTSPSLTLINCTVIGNSADRAAGINFKDSNGTLSLTDVSVSGNIGSDEGSGVRVFAAGATVTMNRVTVSGNTGLEGAGIYLREMTAATLDNVTISGNTTTSRGGGLAIDMGTATLTNVTITGNNAPGGTGGGIARSGGTIQLKNSIVAANPTGDDCDGAIVSLGNNLDGDGSCGFALTASPQLGALQDNGGLTWTHALELTSPAVDAGTNSGCPPVDQRGQGRPFDGDGDLTATCDIGAFESHQVVRSIVKRAYQLDGTPIADGSTLPKGMPIRFLIYIDNPAGAMNDVSLRDVLAAAFLYQPGTMAMDGSLQSSVVCPGGICNEATIFAQVDGSGTALGDGDAVTAPIDGDEASYDSLGTTIHVGDSGNPNNAPLDLAADTVWALVFTVTIQ